MRTGYEERANLRRQPFRLVEQLLDTRCKPQIPANGAEGNRAHGGSVGQFLCRGQRVICGATAERYARNRARRLRQGLGSGSPATARAIGYTTVYGKSSGQPSDRPTSAAVLAKSRAETGRLPGR